MKTIKMVVLAILAMVFAFPAIAADQPKQVQKPQVQKVDMKQKGWLLKSMRPIAPPPGIDKTMVQCGPNEWAYGSCKNGPAGKVSKQ